MGSRANPATKRAAGPLRVCGCANPYAECVRRSVQEQAPAFAPARQLVLTTSAQFPTPWHRPPQSAHQLVPADDLLQTRL